MPRACLTKHARLLKSAEFNYVFDRSVRSSDRYFTVLARPNNLHQSRLGMAFTKKRVKLAVARNRLKRISRESFRLMHAGPKDAALDYVVLAGPDCKDASNQQLFNSLAKHWQTLIKKCTKS